MKVLIIYGTTEGHTRKISLFMQDVLQDQGHQVTIYNATENPPNPDDYDAVFIGSSIHMHSYHDAIKSYVHDHVKTLNEKPTAFFSVCLAIASGLAEEEAEVVNIVDDFVEGANWRPNQIKHIAGALKYSEYNYFKRLVMRMIVKKQGGDTDTSQDYEYTDWEGVRSFCENFSDQYLK